MKKLMLLLLVFALVSCATTVQKTEPVTAINDTSSDARYVNNEVGIALTEPEGWSLVSRREESPDYFLELLPEGKDPNESPLFLGYNSEETAFFRCTLEKLGEESQLTLESYFQLLYAMSEDQLDSVRRAEISNDPAAIQWEYTLTHEGYGFLFFETLFFHNNYAVRLSFWTPQAVASSYRPQFETITGALELLENDRWNMDFKNIKTTLSADNLDLSEISKLQEQVATEESCPDGRQNLLWKIEESNPPIYLFGSIHLGSPDFYPFNETIETAFASSDNLVVEANSLSEDFQQTIQKMQVAGMLPEGQTLKDVISDELYKKVEARFQTFGMPLAPFSMYKPWMISMVLTTFHFQALGYSQKHGVDQYFLTNAVRKNQPILEIEDPDTTIEMMNEMDGELFLAYTLLSMDTLDNKATSMMKAWKCGDTAKLQQLIEGGLIEQMPAIKPIFDRLFYERNEKMAQTIMEYLNSGTGCFIVVGAGHLVGNQSVISHLESQGYSVTRIK